MNTIFQYFVSLMFISIMGSASGCTSTGVDNGQAMPDKIVLKSKDSGETVKEFSDAENIENVFMALNSKEKTQLKLLPLFEYQIRFTENGEQQIWNVNKAGYLKKSDESQLYKADVSALFK